MGFSGRGYCNESKYFNVFYDCSTPKSAILKFFSGG